MALPNLGALRLADDDRGATTDEWVQYQAPDPPDPDDPDAEPFDPDHPDHCCPINADRFEDGQWLWKSEDGQGRTLYDPRAYWSWLVGPGDGNDPVSRARITREQLRALTEGPPEGADGRERDRLELASEAEARALRRRWFGDAAAAEDGAADEEPDELDLDSGEGGGSITLPALRIGTRTAPLEVDSFDSMFVRDMPFEPDDVRRAMVAARFGFRVLAETIATRQVKTVKTDQFAAFARLLVRFAASGEPAGVASETLLKLTQDPPDVAPRVAAWNFERGNDPQALWMQLNRGRMLLSEMYAGRDVLWDRVWGHPDPRDPTGVTGLLLQMHDGALFNDGAFVRLAADGRGLPDHNARNEMPYELTRSDAPRPSMHRLEHNQPPFDADEQRFDDVASLNPLEPYLWTATDIPRRLRFRQVAIATEMHVTEATFKVTVSIPTGTHYDFPPRAPETTNDPPSNVRGPAAIVKIEVPNFASLAGNDPKVVRSQRNLLCGLREMVRALYLRPIMTGGPLVRADGRLAEDDEFDMRSKMFNPSELNPADRSGQRETDRIGACEWPPNSGVFYFRHGGLSFPGNEPAAAGYDERRGVTSVCDPATYLMLVLKALFGPEPGIHGGVWWRGRMPTPAQGAGMAFCGTTAAPSDPPDGFAPRPFTATRFPRGPTALRTAFGRALGGRMPIPDARHSTGILRRELGLRYRCDLHQSGSLSTERSYGSGGARGFDFLWRQNEPPREGLGTVDYDVNPILDELQRVRPSREASAVLGTPDTRARHLSTFATFGVAPRPSSNWLVRWEAGDKHYHFFWRAILPDYADIDPMSAQSVRAEAIENQPIGVPRRRAMHANPASFVIRGQEEAWTLGTDQTRANILLAGLNGAWLEVWVDFPLPQFVPSSTTETINNDGVVLSRQDPLDRNREGGGGWCHGPPVTVKLLARRRVTNTSGEAGPMLSSGRSDNLDMANQLTVNPPPLWLQRSRDGTFRDELWSVRLLSEAQYRSPYAEGGIFGRSNEPNVDEYLCGLELKLCGTRYRENADGTMPVVPPTLYMMHALERLFGTSDDDPDAPFTRTIAGMEYPSIDPSHSRNITGSLLIGWQRPTLMSWQRRPEAFVHARAAFVPQGTGATMHYALQTTLVVQRERR